MRNRTTVWYAFVFGSRDTCRVIRRQQPPRRSFDEIARRPPGPDWRGGPGETLVKEFVFGSLGRPVHILLTGDARFLLAFANRDPSGAPPRQDRLWYLEEDNYAEAVDYARLGADPLPDWPKLARALAKARPPQASFSDQAIYAFLSLELARGRLLVARETEEPGGGTGEFTCFAIQPPDTRAVRPTSQELHALLERDDPLFRAAAAAVLGRTGTREDLPGLRRALKATHQGAARATLAGALVRLGDSGEVARGVLRGLVAAADDPGAVRAAAGALARLPPDRGEVDALVGALPGAARPTAQLLELALARAGAAAVPALIRLSRSAHAASRIAAARTLGRFDAPKAEQRLLTLVGDKEETVAKAAATALTAPPRKVLAGNRGRFARALLACATSKNRYAARRLSILAAHARIDEEKVLEALVALAPLEPKAIWALAHLTGAKLATPEDCRRWLRGAR